ncbi:hypothetical protein [Methylobacter tundripaludum]|uniref:Peptidase YpeB-like protein n=1 Tax=Methylobacter tundripaludum (strain ATCC BAA-1195 / DSM 17260 / SV96) TaxID=697282 RepID=G3IQP1_METTV|nr:hypothetical protein [Methylobacter tundripaludum]EGW23241.1 hypothetical protein Mettu_2089 [Methylobacter tundripaludum SV96]
MNNKFIKFFMILMSSLMTQAAFSNTFYTVDTLSGLTADRGIVGTNANMTDRYTLPPNKVYIEPCQREGLLRHPGVIEKQQILHRHGDFWVRLEIQTRGGSEWFALCDLKTGKIIREQKLIDDVF